ncbi:hypothetical protein [Amnibacterium endophyticum]|uniref:GNAT family N-acetyltransferase n=1 Tax=Amnibacterium endophyticum TaxID=2109337 RepID=A0ABW4LGY5_9MICO
MRDEDFVRALRALDTDAFTVRDVRPSDVGTLELRFATRSDLRLWSLVLPLPSAPVLKPWLYRPPDDAVDSARMLAVFLDEEILTTAISSARGEEVAGVTLVELAPYGLRRGDDAEHERLAAAAAAGGWDGRGGSVSAAG